MQAVNPVNIAVTNCDKKRKSRGKWIVALLVFRQEEVTGLVKLLLPKPSMKPCVIHITILPLVSL